MYFDTTMKHLGESLTHLETNVAKTTIGIIAYNLYKHATGYKNRAVREMTKAYNAKCKTLQKAPIAP